MTTKQKTTTKHTTRELKTNNAHITRIDRTAITTTPTATTAAAAAAAATATSVPLPATTTTKATSTTTTTTTTQQCQPTTTTTTTANDERTNNDKQTNKRTNERRQTNNGKQTNETSKSRGGVSQSVTLSHPHSVTHSVSQQSVTMSLYRHTVPTFDHIGGIGVAM